MSEEPLYQHRDQSTPPAAHEPSAKPHRFWMTVLTVLITAFVTFSLTVGLGAAVLSGAGFFSSSGLPGTSSALSMIDTTDPDTRDAVKKLEDIYDLVDQQYVEDLTDAEMIAAMARGLIAELDNPYTYYLSAEQNRQISDSMSGNYSGIGAMVAMNKEGLAEIVELTPGSPAIEAGVKIGDQFLAVDGTDVTGVSDISEVAALVRGPEGTNVEIVFYRPSIRGEVKMVIERKRIVSTTSVYRMLEDEIGYIQIREFSTGVSGQFENAFESLQKEGARHIVIDLRNNGGGLATEVLAMLDYLLPEVELTRFIGRSEGKSFTDIKMSDRKSAMPTDMRFAILVNGMTASASELMSGCLRDHDLAYLIGEQTFGKGSGTVTYGLDDGSAVNLTNFLYYLPDGESIEGEGLIPDEIVSLPEELQDQSLALIDPAEDTQLQAGIAYLRRLIGLPSAA